MSKYPRIGGVRLQSRNATAKCGCGKLAKLKVDIQYTYMRGDDDVVWSCYEHKNDLEFLTRSRA